MHFVAYLSIMDVINARKTEHIRVTKKYFALKRKEATKLFFKEIATSSALLLPSHFRHNRSNLFIQSFVKLHSALYFFFALQYVEIKCQLDATEVFIADLIACSTCFGHHYAHHQELKSIIQWLLPVVFCAVVFQVAGLV